MPLRRFSSISVKKKCLRFLQYRVNELPLESMSLEGASRIFFLEFIRACKVLNVSFELSGCLLSSLR